MRPLARHLVAIVVGLGAVSGAVELWARQRAADVQLLDSARRYRTWPGKHGANRDGFHEREPDALPAGPRVLVLGDSMTWGTGTAEEAWPRVAERARIAAGASACTFVNVSTYGYDTAQEAATLREALGLAPAAVVLAAYWNDLLPTRVIQTGAPPLPMWIASDGPRPAAWRLVRGLAEAALRPERLRAPDRAAFAQALADIRRIAGARPVQALVLWPQSLAGGVDACAARTDRATCEEAAALSAELPARIAEAGIPVLDARDALTAPDPDAPDWQHPGPAGQAQIGAWVAAHLTLP